MKAVDINPWLTVRPMSAVTGFLCKVEVGGKYAELERRDIEYLVEILQEMAR